MSADAKRRRELLRRIKAVADSQSDSFQDLMRAAGYRDMRFRNMSGLSFAGQDLRGIDFTGANLSGCDFTDAQIEGARFDAARLGQVPHFTEGGISPGDLGMASLVNARDWEVHRRRWKRAKMTFISDSHLPTGAVFRDSSISPEMVVLPSRHPLTNLRFAVGRRLVLNSDLTSIDDYSLERADRSPDAPLFVDGQGAREYFDELQECLPILQVPFQYRLLTNEEWMMFCRPYWRDTKDGKNKEMTTIFGISLIGGYWEMCNDPHAEFGRMAVRSGRDGVGVIKVDTLYGDEDDDFPTAAFRCCRYLND